MQPDNTDILLSGSLLGLDKSCCAIDTDNQTSSNLGIESAAVSGLFDSVDQSAHVIKIIVIVPCIPEHSLHPGDHLVTGRVGRLVEIYDT